VNYRVGTRRSKLALRQTEMVCADLERAVAGLSCQIVPIRTTGDVVSDRPLRDAGGKGLFVKELDESLLAGEIDFAVHSMKDVPTELPDGIRIAAVPKRLDARDVLLSMAGWRLDELPDGAVIGTTSLRRQAQTLAARASTRVSMLRGNVETRVRRVVAGDFHATFLAAAGLARLAVDVSPLVAVALDAYDFVPAAGQGALCLTVRDTDAEIAGVLSVLDDLESRAAVCAEREAARALGGSCQLPVAAFAERRGEDLCLVALVASPDGERVLRRHGRAPLAAGESLGARIGKELLEAGADEILAAVEDDPA
jgi:hydroxymethylbilane synthase